MRFGCETRLPWSPPRTKTSNTTTPKSHENPNSSSVKGGNVRRQSRRRFSGEKFGVGFILRNPQQTTAMLGEPANTATASTRSYRHRQSENCCRDTVTHTHIAREVLRRKSVGHAGLNGKWLCDSPLTFVPFAGVPANMRHWRPLLQTLSVKRLAFSLEEVIKERPVKKMLPAELKCKIG